jgi:hypothetical protein
MIFNKDDLSPEDLKEMQTKISDALAEKWGPEKAKWPRQLKICLRDADNEDRTNEADASYDPNYVNAYFMNARTRNKPGIVDENVDPIMDQDEFYSGCYARATVVFQAYDKGGGKGVGCYLNNIMKVADGDRLGGAASPEKDFAAFKKSDADKDSAEDFVG